MQHRNVMGTGHIGPPKMIPEQIARQVFNTMDMATRTAIFKLVGVSDPDRVQRAVEYLREPIHMAQFEASV